MATKHTLEEYIAPCIEVLDVVSENVFCTSTVTINDWEEDEDCLEFAGW